MTWLDHLIQKYHENTEKSDSISQQKMGKIKRGLETVESWVSDGLLESKRWAGKDSSTTSRLSRLLAYITPRQIHFIPEEKSLCPAASSPFSFYFFFIFTVELAWRAGLNLDYGYEDGRFIFCHTSRPNFSFQLYSAILGGFKSKQIAVLESNSLAIGEIVILWEIFTIS